MPGPRGHKPWALFACIVLGRSAPSRSHLVELLFSDAEDPLGALRWNLAEMRRRLKQRDALTGDPVRLALSPATSVDVLVLTQARPGAFVPDAFGGELLEGMSFPRCPSFEAWLLIERRHMAALVEGLLRERALLLLGTSRAREAASAAARLVATEPLDERNHELLVRCLLEAGDQSAARAQVKTCEALLRHELGTRLSPRLENLLRVSETTSATPPVGRRAAARAEFDAGRAAIAAGEIEAGIRHLREASSGAHGCEDVELQARALLTLGSTLVHAMRGHDEGAVALHAAVCAADRAGSNAVAATAFRELGFIDVQAGRRERAEQWLVRAENAAHGADNVLAAVCGVRGMNLSDAGRYRAALEWLERSIDHAQRCGDRRQVAWSTSLIGRIGLLTGDYGAARAACERSVDLVTSEQWIAFLPWPNALRAEVDIRQGRLKEAHERLEHAFTLACHLADPCWEGVAARGLGVVEARCQRAAQAMAWLADGRGRCTRVPAPWEWVHGFVLDTLCETALAQGDARAATWVEQLATLGARADMREFAVHAQLYRHRMGVPGALEAARALARDVDNPALELA